MKEHLKKKRSELNLPRGLYVYGGPGSGKTFLMDLFYETLHSQHKRRVHFNEFMLEVHRSLHRLSKKGYSGSEMMQRFVQELSETTRILCFDEFQVTDIADAMIMKQLFSSLFEAGVLIIMTSNRSPDDLYKNGIQRDLFVPFIEDVKANYGIVQMTSETDYRTLILNTIKAHSSSTSSLYFLSSEKKPYEELWNKITGGEVILNSTMRVQGRDVPIAKIAKTDDVARFDFLELCGKPLGSGDYQAIAANFHTIFLDNIPELSLVQLNQIRRFITLIDTFYDQHIVVVSLGEKPVDKLLNLGDVKSEEDAAKLNLQSTDLLGTATYVPTKQNVDEVFAFQRTVSRLTEMQRPEYLEHSSRKQLSFIDGISPLRFFNSIGLKPSQSEAILTAEQMSKVFERYAVSSEEITETEFNRLLKEIKIFFDGHQMLSSNDLKSAFKKINRDENKLSVSLESVAEYLETHSFTDLLK